MTLKLETASTAFIKSEYRGRIEPTLLPSHEAGNLVVGELLQVTHAHPNHACRIELMIIQIEKGFLMVL